MEIMKPQTPSHVAKFEASLIDNGKYSESTVSSYLRDVACFYRFLSEKGVDSENIGEISTELLLDYFVALDNSGRRHATIARHLASLKQYFNYLAKAGVINENPCPRLEKQKTTDIPQRVLSRPDVSRLLTLPKGMGFKAKRDRAMLELCYCAGLKVSELLDIKLSDIKLSEKCIICAKGNRILPLTASAVSAISEYLAVRPNYNGFVFLNPSGEKLTRQGFWKLLRSYGEQAGFPNLSPNLLRRSFVSHMLENGASEDALKELLGRVAPLDATYTKAQTESQAQSLNRG